MAPGRKTGGRRKGTPNKVDSDAKRAFLATFQHLEQDLEEWIKREAEENPGKAADILVRMAAFHFPRMEKSEIGGPDGAPLRVVYRIEEG